MLQYMFLTNGWQQIASMRACTGIHSTPVCCDWSGEDSLLQTRGGYSQQPRYVSRYIGHDTIRIAIVIHGSRFDTYRDTWPSIQYLSCFLGLYFQKFKLFFNVVSY